MMMGISSFAQIYETGISEMLSGTIGLRFSKENRRGANVAMEPTAEPGSFVLADA